MSGADIRGTIAQCAAISSEGEDGSVGDEETVDDEDGDRDNDDDS